MAIQSSKKVLDPREQALLVHEATYGRIDWPEDAVTVFAFAEQGPRKVIPTADANAFADAAVAGNDRELVWATITPRHADLVKDGSSQMGTTDTLVDPRMIFIDLDTGKPGYAATIEEAVRIAESFVLEPHAITCSGGGLQLFYLLEQGLSTTKERLLLRNVESAFKDHLGAAGLSMDAGVTGTLTRPCRVPGSWNRKQQYLDEGGALQAYLVKANLDVPLYSLADIEAACPEDRTFNERYADTTMSGTQMANKLPIGRILSEVHGWTLTGSNWNAHVEGASTKRSGSKYLHEDAGVETMVVWSGSTADEYDVKMGHPYSSFDWLAVTLCNGSYALATRLAAQAAEAGSYEELLDLFRGKEDGTKFTPAELADIARGASRAWPEGLSKAHASALAFRGVAADVATARGYQSVEALAALPGGWADSMQEHGERGIKVDGAGLRVGVHGATKELAMTHTVRADASARFEARGKKGSMEPIENPAQGMMPFTPALWTKGALDANPMVKGLVEDREIPLILVSSGIKWSMSQIHADGIVSAARREELDVAVVSSEFFSSTIVLAGSVENSTRQDRLGSAWTGIPLRDRTVYLAGRETWRRAKGLTALGKALAAKGAEVRVLAFPMSKESFQADASVPSVADYLASGHKEGTLASLMEGALSLEQAVAESVSYDPSVETEVAERLISEFSRLDSYRYHFSRDSWIRNEGPRCVPCPMPTAAAAAILKRDGFKMPAISKLKSFVKDYAAGSAELLCDPISVERDPMELNVLNGVLNLKTGQLRERRHGEVHEVVAAASFDPQAKAPQWEAFLDEIMPDKDTQRSLQEMIGAAATGSPAAEVLPLLVGSGANGKSIFMRSIMDILGAFASTLSAQVIENGLQAHEWASLQSVHLALISELKQGAAADTGTLKSLTTTDIVNAAFKYGHSFTYAPKFSCFIMSNHLPYFKETDDGVWRRLKVVRFGVTIPAEKRDKTLLSKLATERDGILLWILEGAMRFLESGQLYESPAIVQDTAAYKMELDLLGQFFAEGEAHFDPVERVKTTELRVAFNSWQETNGHRTWSTAALTQKLRERGVERAKNRGEWYFNGVALGPSMEQVAEELQAPDDASELAPATPASPAEVDPMILDVQQRRTREISARVNARLSDEERLNATGGW